MTRLTLVAVVVTAVYLAVGCASPQGVVEFQVGPSVPTQAEVTYSDRVAIKSLLDITASKFHLIEQAGDLWSDAAASYIYDPERRPAAKINLDAQFVNNRMVVRLTGDKSVTFDELKLYLHTRLAETFRDRVVLLDKPAHGPVERQSLPGRLE